MRHFSIDSDNNIAVHASRKAAKETGNPVFSNEVQFADVIGPDNKRLLEIWNGLPGIKPVTKFANRKIATARIWEAIQQLGAPAPAEPAPEKPAETTSADPIPAVATPFDLPAAKPIPQGTAPEAPAEPAPVPVVGQPSATVEAPEDTATVSAQAPDVAPAAAKSGKNATRSPKPPKAPKSAKAAKTEGAREGSKTAQVVALLKRKNGATLAEIMEKMGWLRHTVRGFVAGSLKKAGYTVESFKPEGGERTYRINP
jgi:outer membrane biosynthesis protein TonB